VGINKLRGEGEVITQALIFTKRGGGDICRSMGRKEVEIEVV